MTKIRRLHTVNRRGRIAEMRRARAGGEHPSASRAAATPAMRKRDGRDD
jgi:hypothetical protein